MDNLIFNLTNLSMEQSSAHNEESIRILIKEYFSLVEQESIAQQYIDELYRKWRTVGTECLTILKKLVEKEMKNLPTVLNLRKILAELNYYNATRYRDADEYYMNMLHGFIVEVLEQVSLI